MQRLLSLLMSVALLMGAAAPVGAAEMKNIPFVQVDNSTVTATPHQDAEGELPSDAGVSV